MSQQERIDNALKYLSFFLLMSFLIFPVLQCMGQTTNPKITQEQYQWNDDMKRLKITTPERGLIFKITISNEGDNPLEIDKLYINVRIDSPNRQYWYFFKQMSIDYLYLPKNEDDYRFVKVDFGGSQVVGSYTAKLTYFMGSVSGEGTPIEIYPFDFRVLGEDAFQQEIRQNQNGGSLFNIGPINITLFDLSVGGPITIVSIGVIAYFLNRKRKKRSE